MKKLLPIVIMISALQSVLAGSTNVYVEDWGSLKGGASENNANVSTVGWTGVAISQTAGPYMGIYLANGAADAATGLPLPTNTVYFTTLLPHQTNAAMFYTMDSSGAGTGGDASFADITPTQYTNLTLNVEVRGNATDTNYFAVQVGGSWYVCTSYQMPASIGLSYPVFTNATLVYTNPANVWQNLTIGTTNVTIGSTASLNTSSTITGIGIVQLPTSAGFNYNELTIQAYVPAVTPPTAVKITATAVTPQYAYVGGGAAFEIFAGGTQPLTYFWESNGVPLLTGGRYFGTTNNYFNITNINLNDAGSGIYSVIVTNIAGSATDLDLTLDVSNVPPGLLYAEDFPYVGPSGSGNLSLASVGWVSSASVGTSIGIYQSGGGLGDAFSYSGTATTNLYYTTDTNDVGFSGLPFIDINPNN